MRQIICLDPWYVRLVVSQLIYKSLEKVPKFYYLKDIFLIERNKTYHESNSFQFIVNSTSTW